MGIKKLLSVATFLVAGSLAHTAWAQTDVTSTYLTNADFSSTDGWTVNKSAQYSDLGNGLIGTYQANSNGSVSTVDATHLATEYCFGFECRWQTNFSSYYQETSSALPVGQYTLTFDVENTNSTTTSANYNNMFTVKVGETTYTDESTEWMKGKSSWTTHSITFVVKETATATISLGYGTGSNNLGSTATPVIHVSHLKLIYTDLLTGAKTTLQAEIEVAESLVVAETEKEALETAIETAKYVLTNASTEAELKEAKTALKIAENIAKGGMTGASEELAAEITVLLSNPSFENNDAGWTMTSTFTNWGANAIAGDAGYLNKQQWNGNFEVSQTLNNIPNGVYKLTVQGFYRPGGNDATSTEQNAILYANDATSKIMLVTADGKEAKDDANGFTTAYTGVTPNVYVPNDQNQASKAFINEAYKGNEVVVKVTNNSITFGAKKETAIGNDWTVIDNFQLYYYGENADGILLGVAKDELAATISSVSSLNTTINVGTGAFQIPSSAVTTLTNAVATATSALNADDATKASLEEANTALKSAIEAYKNVELNAPAENTRYNVVLNFEGWDYDNKAITFIAGGRNDAGLYNIQYLVDPNPNYAQAIIFTKAEGANRYTMSIMDVDGNQRYICTGVPYGGNTSQIRTTTDASKALVVEIRVTNVEGNLNIFNTEANIYIGSQDAGVFTVNSHIDFNIVEAVEAEVTLNIAAGKYATRIFPFAAEIPAGVTVYSCAAIEEGQVLTEVEKTIAPNVPYILYSEEGVETTLTGYGTAIKDTYEAGLLTGVYGTGTVPVGSYVLQTQEGVQGFYKVVDEPVAYVPYRAYLTDSSANAKAFFFGGDVTSINGVTDGATEVVRYNAAGVKVNAPVKGLNIVKMSDGTVKKVMVK